MHTEVMYHTRQLRLALTNDSTTGNGTWLGSVTVEQTGLPAGVDDASDTTGNYAVFRCEPHLPRAMVIPLLVGNQSTTGIVAVIGRKRVTTPTGLVTYVGIPLLVLNATAGGTVGSATGPLNSYRIASNLQTETSNPTEVLKTLGQSSNGVAGYAEFFTKGCEQIEVYFQLGASSPATSVNALVGMLPMGPYLQPPS